jgi:nucleoside-diphosphate-sugar epimerase
MPQRHLVTGAAGFLGSHLCDALVARGDDVVGVDSLITGHLRNVAHLDGCPRFSLLLADVSDDFNVGGPFDTVLHFASPASPPRYLAHPIATLRVGAGGTDRLLELATSWGARFLLASTSEVYGDPAVHPQRETYWGNVNPHGPRSVYDEAKRYAEALTFAYHRALGTDVGIVRIFNTYGPRLDPDDGRVVSTFLRQAICGEPLTIFGDGSQTRSFCYVDDEVRGILTMLDSALTGPVNIGNPVELTLLDLAEEVRVATGEDVEVAFGPLPQDDPKRRCPDIELARRELGWEPQVALREGLIKTAEWFRDAGLGLSTAAVAD